MGWLVGLLDASLKKGKVCVSELYAFEEGGRQGLGHPGIRCW